jgi:hypothetical protein
VPLALPHGRASRRRTEAPEPTLLDAQPASLEIAPPEKAEEEPAAAELDREVSVDVAREESFQCVDDFGVEPAIPRSAAITLGRSARARD